MNGIMKTIHILPTLLLASCCFADAQAQKPDTIWVSFSNRFIQNEPIRIAIIDSIEFQENKAVLYQRLGTTGRTLALSRVYRDGTYSFEKPGRTLVVPSLYASNDYTWSGARWSLERCQESEHFALFWDKTMSKNDKGLLTATYSTYRSNANQILEYAEKAWSFYADSLGFLVTGKSISDKFKTQLYIVDQNDWRADASGTDGTYYRYTANTETSAVATAGKTGIAHWNPWAASDMVTRSHEIGHTFQYLVSADLGDTHGMNYVLGENSSGNEWWEDCANWMAHKLHPTQQFTSNWGNNMNMHHMNILHEDARYNNCYYHDWWCQLHGMTTIGRIWRESIRPEDPVQAYMRLFGLNEETFADEMWLGYAHMACMDIDCWKKYSSRYFNQEKQRLKTPSARQKEFIGESTTGWLMVDSAYCVQNYGYNANPLTVPTVGTTVTVHFKGLAGAPGFRAVNTQRAGWRYGLVAYSSDGTYTYGEMQSAAEGSATLTVPAKCANIWLVVMGAPTTYWTHPWNGSVADDEQWPYAVRIEGTTIKQ